MGGNFGLAVSDDFLRGSSAFCETYMNEPLCDSGEDFSILDVEVYGFERESYGGETISILSDEGNQSRDESQSKNQIPLPPSSSRLLRKRTSSE